LDFTNLEELDCIISELASLNLSHCNKLKKLYCSYNRLTQIIYPTNPELLTELCVSNNNFPIQNLSVFSRLQNLEKLNISNSNKNKISQEIYNRFMGSSKPLKYLSKLRNLDISNTDIDRGLEHLPTSIHAFYCSFADRSKARVSDI